MDPEIAALAGTAGTTLVSLLATEAWESAREGFAGLWSRVRPERAEAVSAELEATRDDLLTARAGDDQDTEAELSAEWQGRVRRLLTAHPGAADELRRVLAELAESTPQVAAPTVTQHATASGDSRVYQAGRDMHLGQQ
jgi:hypothetical protein